MIKITQALIEEYSYSGEAPADVMFASFNKYMSKLLDNHTANQILIFEYYLAPLELRAPTRLNGGDEDYMIIARYPDQHTARHIADRLQVCSVDEYVTEDSTWVIFVTSHS